MQVGSDFVWFGGTVDGLSPLYSLLAFALKYPEKRRK